MAVKDPSAATLVQGYPHGLFTFAHIGPLKWVSLPERCGSPANCDSPKKTRPMASPKLPPAHTSKIAMAALTWHLAKWGFAFSDGKWETPTMRDMGFRCVPRAEFLTRLAGAVHAPGRMGRWRTEADLPTVAAWTPGQPGTAGGVPA